MHIIMNTTLVSLCREICFHNAVKREESKNVNYTYTMQNCKQLGEHTEG